MNRRQFIRTGAVALGLAAGLSAKPSSVPVTPTAGKLPRWRGFNLLEKFTARAGGNPPFQEADFARVADWGFDFVRLPMSYLCWATHDEPLKLRQAELAHVDQAVEFGHKYGVHVNLNLHRAPGYCVNPPREPWDLWSDDKALETCAFHWAHLARRFKGVPNSRLSFNLLNEPGDIPEETYVRVVRRLVEAIRAEDQERLIVADGLKWGTQPVPGLIPLGVAQSTRGYQPMQISHYRANWIGGSDRWAEPTWPLKFGDSTTDKETLRRQGIEPWRALERRGVGVHVGEWGAFNRTPHKVVLAWMRDCLELWKEAGWGWALWNLRGPFGVLDSGRTDVNYEESDGHKLDRAMLKLLQAG